MKRLRNVLCAVATATMALAGLTLSGCNDNTTTNAVTNTTTEAVTQAAAPQETVEWKLVTSWPKNFPGLGSAPVRFAEMVNTMSGGRMKVTVYGGGELVPPLGVFDAVSNGSVQMGHTAAYYWKGKAPAAQFFATVPYGMTATEVNAWLQYGGGQELWEETYAPFNVLPMAGGNSSAQMGGWFNKEINSVEDIKGLKMRIPGMAGDVVNKLGGTSVTLPGGEIFTSLKTGVIDATEWVGPYNDLAFGLHQAAKYYYYPGWHEPGTIMEFLINKEAFEALPKDLQAIVRTAGRAVNADMLDEYTARNAIALDDLLTNHNVQLKRFPDDVLRQFRTVTGEVMAEQAQKDAQFAKVMKSYQDFQAKVKANQDISVRAFEEARALK